MTDEPDLPVLTAKLIHEMFHGYQFRQNWTCWADEMEALFHYQYHAENLCLKLRENDLLLSMLDHFDASAYQELLSHRKRRSEKYPYEFAYESKVEEIEGTATYVEWMVLKQLDNRAASAMAERMRAVMTKPDSLFPIRISSYDTGALMTYAMICAGNYPISAVDRPAVALALQDVPPSDGSFPGRDACFQRVSAATSAFHRESEAIIQAALEQNHIVAVGPLELLGVNIYDARCCQGYLTSSCFLQYQDEHGAHTLSGDFVLQMADETTISRVYRLDPPTDAHS